MRRTIDFHAHLLPFMDHGCEGLDMCRRQLKMAHGAGIDSVVATPHFYPTEMTVEDFLSRRAASLTAVEEIRTPDMPEIIPGAEVQLAEPIYRLEGLERLCIQGTNIILAEMPRRGLTRHIFDAIEKIQSQRGLNVVIAHPNRYSPKTVERLIEMELPLQLNAEFITKRKTRRLGLAWIEAGHVWALGSDIHTYGEQYEQFRNVREEYPEEFGAIMQKTEFLLELFTKERRQPVH